MYLHIWHVASRLMCKLTIKFSKKMLIFKYFWSTIALYFGRTPSYDIYELIGLGHGTNDYYVARRINE